jgi:hypothetical protein
MTPNSTMLNVVADIVERRFNMIALFLRYLNYPSPRRGSDSQKLNSNDREHPNQVAGVQTIAHQNLGLGQIEYIDPG